MIEIRAFRVDIIGQVNHGAVYDTSVLGPSILVRTTQGCLREQGFENKRTDVVNLSCSVYSA
jgi:hypothetical protein